MADLPSGASGLLGATARGRNCYFGRTATISRMSVALARYPHLAPT
jgi:hypothetical protein